MAIMNAHDVSNKAITSKIEAKHVQGNHNSRGERTTAYREGQWIPPGSTAHSRPTVGYTPQYAQNYTMTFGR